MGKRNPEAGVTVAAAAVQQNASAAVQQNASAAVQQNASAAVQQNASAAVQQNAGQHAVDRSQRATAALLGELQAATIPLMASFTVRYSVGNEHAPGDPWGRSELVIHADGSARLDHHFSRGREPRAWTGHVDPAALTELLAALDRAGFPAVPPLTALPPGTALRRLAVEADGVTRQAILSWHETPSAPGYAEAFDLIDAVIRQLSEEAVTYPTRRGPVVHDIAEVRAEVMVRMTFGPNHGIAFSPDGTLLAVCSAHHIEIIRGSDVLRLIRGHTGTVADVAFAPDGRTIVTGSYDGTARTWDVATGRPRVTFAGHR